MKKEQILLAIGLFFLGFGVGEFYVLKISDSIKKSDFTINHIKDSVKYWNAEFIEAIKECSKHGGKIFIPNNNIKLYQVLPSAYLSDHNGYPIIRFDSIVQTGRVNLLDY